MNNRKFHTKHATLLFLYILYTSIALAQQPSLSLVLGEKQVAENEYFTITLVIKGERFNEYSDFPEISGFIKRQTTTASSNQIIAGKVVAEQRVTQHYLPNRQGTFQVPAFSMRANGLSVSSPGMSVQVGNPSSASKSDPFADFFGTREEERNYVEVPDDAFFAINSSKNSVYVGEGFHLTIAFYISLKNRATIEFHKVSEQLGEILSKVRPENCWEENFNVNQITPDYVTLNGQQYTQYTIYEGSFFPLRAEDIEIPATALTMLKFKIAKEPSFFGRNMKEDFKTYYSKPKTIRVKELPAHPQRNQVNVGRFRLKEQLPVRLLETGRSYAYSFEIYGEGNIATLRPPKVLSDEGFEIPPPTSNTQISRENGRVGGNRKFNYALQALEPGEYHLANYFEWVFFNTATQRYDTLKPTIAIEAIGSSKRTTLSQRNLNPEGFYDSLLASNNRLKQFQTADALFYGFNALLFVLGGLGVFMLFRKS